MDMKGRTWMQVQFRIWVNWGVSPLWWSANRLWVSATCLRCCMCSHSCSLHLNQSVADDYWDLHSKGRAVAGNLVCIGRGWVVRQNGGGSFGSTQPRGDIVPSPLRSLSRDLSRNTRSPDWHTQLSHWTGDGVQTRDFSSGDISLCTEWEGHNIGVDFGNNVGAPIFHSVEIMGYQEWMELGYLQSSSTNSVANVIILFCWWEFPGKERNWV